ncbi:hypothetical protein [Allostreptomyces psammosilenae]|uniref:Uncharacterized protein n=1 Tax=Allostreptomyces psammosilenae TaxID=1892865 RepID=A0A852ZXU3_9ACTN|nr:hypothetical protein [Allostreptomyces psammosilenae]NYI06060.1 hypothetical protein [Allostreptomyces psammosilenae]
MSGWFIKGITDESTRCDVCGKMELKRVVHLVTGDGDELYAGTTCAARKVGVKAADMNRAVKSYMTRLEIARCDFPDYFRRTFNMSVEQFIRSAPVNREVAERIYRRYMAAEGFTV